MSSSSVGSRMARTVSRASGLESLVQSLLLVEKVLAQEAFELAHAHREVCHGVMQFVVVLENDEGITLAASDQNWMALLSDFISVPVYSSELDASPI